MGRLFKRIVVFTLTWMMMCTAGMTVFGADERGEITINNDPDVTGISIIGTTFSAYKVFDVKVSANASNPSYNYTVAEQFQDFPDFKGKTNAEIMAELELWENNSDELNAFAGRIREYVREPENDVHADREVTADSEDTGFVDLDLGYYIVISDEVHESNGNGAVTALCNLNTVDSADIVIEIKASFPTLTKEVSGGSKSAEAQIGEWVPFTLISTVPNMNGYSDYTYIVSDQVDMGLRFLDPPIVRVSTDSEGMAELQPDVDYTLSFDPQSFEVQISQQTLTRFEVGDEIHIEYGAKVTSDALIYDDDNINTATLQYSNNPYDETSYNNITDEATVYTYGLNIFKQTEDQKPLAGAKFELYNSYSDGVYRNPIQFISDGQGVYTVWDGESESGTVAQIVQSSDDGQIRLTGLNAEFSYYLKEVEAPAGYNLLEKGFEIRIGKERTNREVFQYTAVDEASWTELAYGESIVIENHSGTLLPSTGGIGTRLFTTVGLVLMAGAVAYLFITKRKKK